MKKFLTAIFLFMILSSTFSQTENYNSRFFCFRNSWGLCKSFLNTPQNIQIMDSSQYYYIRAAAMLPNTRTIYAVDNVSNIIYLVKIDTLMGEREVIAEVQRPVPGSGIWDVSGMAWDRTTSQMFAITYTQDGFGRLCTINLTTGQLSVVGVMPGVGIATDLAISNNGILYVMAYTANLYSVNKTTAAATLIGNTGFSFQGPQGMAFDPTTDSLYLAAHFSGSPPAGLYRCNTSTAAMTLIGELPENDYYDGLIIPYAVPRQLNSFNLQAPAASNRIVSVPGSSQTVTFSWDTSGAGANYKWYFGNPTVSSRRINLSTSEISITLTLAKLDSILAAAGFTNNGSATDSAVGQWDVTAFKGPGASGVDSMKAANGPRAITLRRQQIILSAFSLLSPVNATTIQVSQTDTSKILFSWNKSSAGLQYKFLFKNGAAYSDPALLSIQSFSNGYDTTVLISKSRIDSLLWASGVASGDSMTGYWRIRGYYGNDSVSSFLPDRKIIFRRASLSQLNESFISSVFPPPMWLTEPSPYIFTYWSRTYAGSDTTAGVVKYNFWTAAASRPAEALVTPEFPSASANTYLQFNYAHAYFIENGNLLNDSCTIFYSTNSGTSWNRLINMITSSTVSSGINSSPVMSTLGLQTVFTPNSASQMSATKKYLIPQGTNRIKFVAKSAHGNNFFMDNIMVTTETGASIQLNLSPEKYELGQNYPNPFNPKTEINFSLPKSSFVTLKIYDMLGREVQTLVSEFKNAGTYTADFDGANYASGIYFYELTSQDFTGKKKMVLLK
ncbi:MAG: T9SS type A sorting domain-containing protein [Bacteroidetes bacterium]|nr:T9SS type A sorting domain-containing protein [Bacteroidota bacterium]